MQIERQTTPEMMNAVLNHESVRPWVADLAEGPIDVAPVVSDRNNFALAGEHGGCLFFKMQTGLYEVHSFVLPSGRGGWFGEFSRSAVHWMFTRTDAVEILTRVPHGHIGAKAATIHAHGKYEWTRPKECRFLGRMVDVDIYSVRLADWILVADGLIERGQWFHDQINAEAKRLGIANPPHEDDENHNRMVGACVDMVFGSQFMKATCWYNRWSAASRHASVRLLSIDPFALQFDIGVITLDGGEIRILPCH
jgi:hypothetical protein